MSALDNEETDRFLKDIYTEVSHITDLLLSFDIIDSLLNDEDKEDFRLYYTNEYDLEGE